MVFADIHTHILYGTDDGASSQAEMLEMIDLSYNDGIRFMCATPHFCPTEYGNNSDQTQKAFDELKEYCSMKYPNFHLILGNELFYMGESGLWLRQGTCKTMGKSRYALVEFNCTESETNICEGLYSILRSGYVPILAHVERYYKLSVKCIKSLASDGVLFQINAISVYQGIAFFQKVKIKKLLSEKLVSFVSSDGHSSTGRLPLISGAYNYLSEHYGKEYASKLCFENAFELIFKNSIAEEKNG